MNKKKEKKRKNVMKDHQVYLSNKYKSGSNINREEYIGTLNDNKIEH